jgi:hypothetical protein
LPNSSDDRERPSTVPPPELNPLLNPLLGNNMGRWAEVYFTSPPEKREEAVLQLIRELEDEDAAGLQQNDAGRSGLPAPASQDSPKAAAMSAAGSTNSVVRDFVHSGPASLMHGSNTNAASDAQGIACFWCGYVNGAEYRFCGRCGEALNSRPTSSPPYQREDRDTQNRHSKNRNLGVTERKSDAYHLEKYDSEYNSSQYNTESRPELPAEAEARPEPVREPSEPYQWGSDPVPRILPSLEAVSSDDFLRRRADYSSSRLESESSSHSLRPWFAAVFAAVIVALAYTAWRSPWHHTPAPAPANKGETMPAVAPPSAPRVTASPAPSQPLPSTGVPKAAPATSNPPTPAVSPEETPASALGKDTAELDQARDFLDGRNGKQRNTAEAAEWLWRAVRKQNAEATVLLAGLYLRGDGVAKSCDQARLLLDAAAAKGRKDAAEQLQHLPAFGCQ